MLNPTHTLPPTANVGWRLYNTVVVSPTLVINLGAALLSTVIVSVVPFLSSLQPMEPLTNYTCTSLELIVDDIKDLIAELDSEAASEAASEATSELRGALT